MRIHTDLIPDGIMTQYKLKEKAVDGYVFVCIKKGMYGLKEAAILAYNQLCTFLNKYGYYHVAGTTGMFKHRTKPTAFCVCIDDIGLKYYNQDDLQHFIKAISLLFIKMPQSSSPPKNQYSPHDCTPITYLKKGQTHLAIKPDSSLVIQDKKIIKRIQSIIGHSFTIVAALTIQSYQI